MARPKFFYDGKFLSGSQIELSEIESRHAVGARRLRAGDEVLLLNGKGSIAQANLVDISNRKALVAQIQSVDNVQVSPYRLEIATAIPKGDRQKVMLDMLTQIGVTHITPLECEYSVTHFKDNLEQRWQRALIESSKQCERVWLPQINECLTPVQLIEQRNDSLIMYCDAKGLSVSNLPDTENAHILAIIGPEGGFSENERMLFKNSQLLSVSLAGNILRTEAAAIVAASQLINLL